ncbi:hypothetical protein JTE90_026421 [Oedothorax gibbosus]|uniref:Uncharacterized protein n=1 Tax=Oedothorax gibbosus TaxID=931172 RepID=A0AAV6TRB6_9ARAC|nr:hypothetical protein JTE90_026421 [Oedothorax gibbosus]
MTDANMNLCKWSSNSDKLVQLWKNNDFHIHPIHSEDTCESDKLHKVLGLPWHIQQDYITLDVTQLLDFDEKSSVTKRLVLSTSGKIFDVLGLVTPYTIRLKCLFQELWLRKISSGMMNCQQIYIRRLSNGDLNCSTSPTCVFRETSWTAAWMVQTIFKSTYFKMQAKRHTERQPTFE